MSRSMTATTTYELSKYSRANPNGRSEAEQEWQHFTNPIITLVVDAKKASTGDIESFRTRVLWAFNAGNDSVATDRNEVVFVRCFLVARRVYRPTPLSTTGGSRYACAVSDTAYARSPPESRLPRHRRRHPIHASSHSARRLFPRAHISTLCALTARCSPPEDI